MESDVQRGRRAEGAAARGELCGAVPEAWTTWYRAWYGVGTVLGVLQCVESPCGIRPERMTSCGWDPQRAEVESDHGGAEEMKLYGLTIAPFPCSPALIEGGK